MSHAQYFTSDSMLRVVQGEQVVSLSGPRALLMQAAHPVAFQGFFAHTGALDDPYGRLERTAEVMSTIAYGPRAEADRATRRVRAIHRRVQGELREAAGHFPTGTPYRADDPALLLWIIATLADSGLLVYQKYVRALSGEERDAYWRDWKVIGRLFGLRDEHMPADIAAFEAYMRRVLDSGDLYVGAQARELAIDVVLRPPVPGAWRPVLELVNQITVGLLPPEVRRLYGFSWDPVRDLALHVGAEYVKRVAVPLLPARWRLTRSERAASAHDREADLDRLRDVA